MAYPASGGRASYETGAFYLVKSTDFNGTIQPALPSVGANSSADLIVTVSRKFRPGAVVNYNRPQGTADPTGISIAAVDCIAPASGSMAAGNPPRVRIRFQNSTAGALTPASQNYELYQE